MHKWHNHRCELHIFISGTRGSNFGLNAFSAESVFKWSLKHTYNPNKATNYLFKVLNMWSITREKILHSCKAMHVFSEPPKKQRHHFANFYMVGKSLHLIEDEQMSIEGH